MNCMDGPCWLSEGWGFAVSLFILVVAVVFLGWMVKEFADYCWYGEWGHDRKIQKWRWEFQDR